MAELAEDAGRAGTECDVEQATRTGWGAPVSGIVGWKEDRGAAANSTSLSSTALVPISLICVAILVIIVKTKMCVELSNIGAI